MLNCAALFLLSFMLLQDFTWSLRLVQVRIPNYVIKGSTAQLECLYDLDGEALYSVKWYKDGNEFYRYVPRDMPPAQTFLLPGVSVDVHNSSDAIVTLREVNLQSAGRFRCEVSGEAPSFQTVTEHGDMVVVSLPDQGPPKISGGRPRYQIGDWVRINCTAGRSKPAVLLSWFVNGEAAEPHTLRKYDTIISGREGLETSVLGLQFRVEQHHFRNGDMKLKCVASLSTFYWRSNEESVEGDRPQKAPVLESRETVYASNSRADPVQANKTDSSITIKPSTIVLLIAMALITTTGCLQQFFLSDIFRIVKAETSSTTHKMREEKMLKNHCSNSNNNNNDHCNDVENVNAEQQDARQRKENMLIKTFHTANKPVKEEKLARITNEKEVMHFNKEMSSLPIIITATAKTTTTSSVADKEITQITTIYAGLLQNTTLETSVSLQITKTTRKSLCSSSCTLSSLSQTKANVKNLKSR